MQQALAEPVAAAAAGEDQGHRRGGDCAILVADQALQHARFALAAAGIGRGRDPLLVRAAQKQPDQRRTVEQTRRRQRLDQRQVALVVRGRAALGNGGADLIGDVSDQAMKHGGHQRPFLLGQPLGRVEEEIGADRDQPVAPRQSRGRVGIGCVCSNRPFLRQHLTAFIAGELTLGQLGVRRRAC